ncbi:MAG: helix-turn-helix domain-containing protein, partial [Pseudomonadota bacterium]
EALRIARLLVLPMKRLGGQNQYSSVLRAQTKSTTGRFDALLQAIKTEPANDYSVPTMATFANMSDRNFARLFTAEIGFSPSLYVEQIRVEAAREALTLGNRRMKSLAAEFGFGSEENMRRAFKRRLGVTPSDIVSQFTSTKR